MAFLLFKDVESTGVFMLTFLAIVHIVIAFALMIFVLLQDPKDGAAGIFGGGSGSNTFFGASGADNFLTTATKWLAVFFAVSCLALTALTSKKSSSVLDSSDSGTAPAAPAPAVPGAASAPGNAGTPPATPAAPAQPAAPATH